MTKQQCPWSYQYKGRARSVNRRHRCNVSCWGRWTGQECLTWLRHTPIHIRGAETRQRRLVTKAELSPPVMVGRVGA
jgi:hypothetical protein